MGIEMKGGVVVKKEVKKWVRTTKNGKEENV